MQGFELAAKLDPDNRDYPLAAVVARNHAITALIQAAAKSRNLGDAAAARAALAHALSLDPKNPQVAEHLNELGDDLVRGETAPLYAQSADAAGEAPTLSPDAGTHSFHLRADARQTIQQVFKAYGIAAAVDDSVHAGMIHFDLDDASFEDAVRILQMVTNSFYVPLDAHRILVARDDFEDRHRFMRENLETVYLPGLTKTELTDVVNLAKNVFNASQSVANEATGAITLRATPASLDAFNATMRDLLDGKSQVALDVRIIQLAHNGERNTGAQLPQQMGVFNIYAEAQSLLKSNASLVQEIVSSGLAAPGDYLSIIAILLASGQVSSSLFSGGIATFGGNSTLTTFGLSPGPATLNMSLNSSDSRELDNLELRVADGETGTVRSGTRYPITTSSFSSLGTGSVNIPGLNTSGLSSSLTSLLANYSGAASNIPMVEYQDLGMTLKTTPSVMRNGDVALNVDLKITALSGQSLNGNPILGNRAFSGVATLKEGEAVVVAGEIDKQESRAISGVPGLSEIPGLNNATSKDAVRNYATLMIVMTPHVLRGPQLAGHSKMMRVERGNAAR